MATRITAAGLVLVLLAGCATTPGEDRLAQKDPLEGFNRTMWDVNQVFDRFAAKPVSTVYRKVIPTPARRGISRVFANLTEPFSFVNNILQGKPDRAVKNLGRFVVNTTIGIGGLGDPATKMGIEPAREDFGQTLAVWGANGGPYLVLPLFGPSTMRDGVGLGVSQFADPVTIAINETDLTRTQKLGISAFRLVVVRADLTESGADAFLKSSLDPYAAAKSAYLQQRYADIRDSDVDSVAEGSLEPAPETGEAAPAATDEIPLAPASAPAEIAPAGAATDAPQ